MIQGMPFMHLAPQLSATTSANETTVFNNGKTSVDESDRIKSRCVEDKRSSGA
jgi:hypothetical protein